MYDFIYLLIYLNLLLETGEGREKEGEKHLYMMGSLLHAPNWGLGLQPRHKLEITPMTFFGL